MIDFIRMRKLMRDLPNIEWDLARLNANATRVTSYITGMPRSGGGNHQEDAYIALADATDAYRAALTELEEMREELDPMIDMLDDINDQGIMRMRYIKGYRPDEIAAILEMTRRNVYYHLSHSERIINRGKQNL